MNLDLERKRLELRRLAHAKSELEFNIMEREADIQRIRDHIALNEKAAAKANEELKVMEGNANE